MRTPELKPAQIRALLFLLVLVPLIPGVLMLRLMFTAIATEKALEHERTADLYRQALRIARTSLTAHLEATRPTPEAVPRVAQEFYQRAFGDEVMVAVERGDEARSGAREPLATEVLPVEPWVVEVYAAPGSESNAEGEDQIRRFIWSSGSALAVSLGIAVLAALVVSRQLHLRELENSAVATVAHELKTPLASSRVLLETLLNDRIEDPEKRREYLEILRRENARLAQLTEAFLVSGRLHSADQRERLELRSIIKEAVSARPDRLELEMAEGPSTVLGDREALLTALGNLIENALKFSQDRVQVNMHPMRGEIAISVIDHGIGIPRPERRRVFQRFYQVDRKLSRVTEGCGLGLSIVREIAEAHGGRVELKSTPGAGSTFTFILPRAESSAS